MKRLKKVIFRSKGLFSLFLVLLLSLSVCSETFAAKAASTSFDLTGIPTYSKDPYVVLNNNTPYFTESELNVSTSFETYSALDKLGRCSVAYANVGKDLMPTEKRGAIGKIKPSGWHTVKYDFVDGKYLYNRCHLIGYQLTGENDNERNLITGTRYLNVQGMLPFENMTADYIKETGNHVLYRVTPVYDGDNLVASGVVMEAMSVEDNGEGILFCIFVYNVQPGVSIDYATGESKADTSSDSSSTTKNSSSSTTYVLNTNNHKFHYPTCGSVKQMKKKNRKKYTGKRADVIKMGYEPCKKCNP
ncbi:MULTISPECIES: DNA/RNA non-specific endonuclease [Clostridia]|uniref:DNA/RNA non-specific endonuclease n=1 Tax=Clostridia TaxID=186801 RepID=UPI000EB1B4FA|nr:MULTISPECIES: DNA/RNA non-specific endonuclease [Clostridia]RKQ29768.1 hypothetical protein D8Q48_06585 [Ruminococcus sp. B05]TAP33144.1 hypothetical protein EYA86_08180 [Mediterraneibacter sp. gm002]